MRTVLLVLAGSLPALAAQTVHVVGPGGFPDIQTAIRAAAAGDVIEITSGQYPGFALDRGLTLRPAPGATVSTGPASFAVPSGQTAHVVSLQIGPGRSRVSAGSVSFSDCTLVGGGSVPPERMALLVDRGFVVLVHCTLRGAANGGAALALAGGTVAGNQCILDGGDEGGLSPLGGGHGIHVTGRSVLHLGHCSVQGGDDDPHHHAAPPGTGIRIDVAADLWLCDSTVRAGNTSWATAVPGIDNRGTTPVRLARNTISGTAGGAAVAGPSLLVPMLGVQASPPRLAGGSGLRLDHTTEPGWPVAVLLGWRLAGRLEGAVLQPVWVPPPPANLWAAFGLADGSGSFAVAFSVPGTPSLRDAEFWLQSFSGIALPVTAAPPVGGVVR